MKFTRRELAATLASVTALAQTPAPPASPDALLQAARDQVKANVDALQQMNVPMTTEPAFSFKA